MLGFPNPTDLQFFQLTVNIDYKSLVHGLVLLCQVFEPVMGSGATGCIQFYYPHLKHDLVNAGANMLYPYLAENSLKSASRSQMRSPVREALQE